MSIRQAAYDDYPVLAKVHVESWKTTYRGMIADAYLDQLTVESRMERWKQLLSREDKDLWTFVSEDEAGRVFGFIQGENAGRKLPGMMRKSTPCIYFRNIRERDMENCW